jgi:alpha-tubulin suppressor-like RCC1 family protein
LAPAGIVGWGNNNNCKIGSDGANCSPGGELARALVEPNQSVGSGASHLAAGSSHVLALSGTTLYCWGNNSESRCTGGAVSPIANAQKILAPNGTPFNFTSTFAAGDAHSVGLTQNGSLLVWGSNRFGETDWTVTLAGTVWPPLAVSLGFANVTLAVAGNHATCVTGTAQRQLSCWGQNGSGQLGRMPSNREPPGFIPGLVDVSAAALGGSHGCAIGRSPQDSATTYGIFCWGNNGAGQVSGAPSGTPLPATKLALPKTPPPP